MGEHAAAVQDDDASPLLDLVDQVGRPQDADSAIAAQPADAVFVHSDHEHLVAALAMRKLRNTVLVRRLGAGEHPDQSIRTRRQGA